MSSVRGEREKEKERARARESAREGGREEARERAVCVCVCYTAYIPAARYMALQTRGYLCTAYRQQQQPHLLHCHNHPHACSHEYSTKRRKLYNGKIPCQLFQYFGEVPHERRRKPGVCAFACARARVACAFLSVSLPASQPACLLASLCWCPVSLLQLTPKRKSKLRPIRLLLLSGELPWAAPSPLASPSAKFGADGTSNEALGGERLGDWICPKCKTLVFGRQVLRV